MAKSEVEMAKAGSPLFWPAADFSALSISTDSLNIQRAFSCGAAVDEPLPISGRALRYVLVSLLC